MRADQDRVPRPVGQRCPAIPLTPISVGIVGAGQVVAETHLPVLIAHAGAQVCWIVDRNADRARALAESAGVAPLALPARPEDLPPADVVLLAIPFGARHDYYPALSERACAVYAEKPFALNVIEHEAVCRLFPAGRLACGYLLRSLWSTQALRAMVRSKVFGRLLSMEVEFGRPGTRTGTYQRDLRLAGGGMLFDVAVHALDLALYVSGCVDIEVSEVEMLTDGGFDLHTEAVAAATASDGASVRLELLVSSLRYTAMASVFRFEHAAVKHAVWGDRSLTVEASDGVRFRLEPSAGQDGPRNSVQALDCHWTVFMEGLDDREPNYTSASETRLTSALVEGLYGKGA